MCIFVPEEKCMSSKKYSFEWIIRRLLFYSRVAINHHRHEILKKKKNTGWRKKMRSFHDYNVAKLKIPKEASLYLTEALHDFEHDHDHDMDSFLKALRDVAEAQGGTGQLAKRTYLNRKNLYKLLSAKRQQTIETLGVIFDGLGYTLNIAPKEEILF